MKPVIMLFVIYIIIKTLMIFFCCSSLPDEVLLNILKYLSVKELCRCASVCVRLNELIHGYHCLWSDIYSESQLSFTKYSLASLFKHSSCIRNLEIPYATYQIYVPEIDFSFIQLVSTTLTNLDITACPLSSLGFLNKLPNLELLTLAECPNLLEEDFDALHNCTQLVYLSVGFTRITSQKLITVISPKLISLDAPGIKFLISELQTLAEKTNITYIHHSLVENINESAYQSLKNQFLFIEFQIYKFI